MSKNKPSKEFMKMVKLAKELMELAEKNNKTAFIGFDDKDVTSVLEYGVTGSGVNLSALMGECLATVAFNKCDENAEYGVEILMTLLKTINTIAIAVLSEKLKIISENDKNDESINKKESTINENHNNSLSILNKKKIGNA